MAPASLAVADALALLAALPGPAAGWEQRVRWWGDWCLALRQDPEDAPWQVCTAVVAALEADPGTGAGVGALLLATLDGCDPGRTLTDTGLPVRPTLVGELLRRLMAKVVPPVAEAEELEDLLDTCFGDPAAAAWLAALPPELLRRFLAATALDRHPGWPALRADAAVAVGVLAARACSDGLSDEARRAIHGERAIQAQFLRLADSGVEVARQAATGGALDAPLAVLAGAVDDCEHAAGRVIARMAEHAVSADLVYRMERLRAGLGRIRQLAGLLAGPADGAGPMRAHRFLAGLCAARLEQASVRALVADHTRLLARRVVLHAAATGSHYITGSFREWRAMLAAAVGGGFAMAVALHAKTALGGIDWPAGVEWLLFGSVYAAAFAWMHLAGWTLATKQPPVTAAALAQAIAAGDQPATIDLLRRLVRSQLVSVAGNLVAVGVLAVAVALLWRLAGGAPLLSEARTGLVLAGHHPTASGVMLFAAETGVVLFLSGLAQGWFANQAQGRNLARGFARNSVLRHLVAPGRRDAWAAAVAAHLPGIGTAVLLGFMLAALPAIGRFTGLPCDLRHVTISAGSVAMALAGEPARLLAPAGLAAVAGVLLVGGINIVVGFTCALLTALRADGLPARSALPLLRALAGDVLRRPLAYLLPLRRGPAGTVSSILPVVRRPDPPT
ncbi:MAG: site-specific recombinase [Planctomycetes bacterium]|nr:site-specific recombinase [Planctomycetota bacterium]